MIRICTSIALAAVFPLPVVAEDNDSIVHEATLPLPEPLRAGASVIKFEKGIEFKTLREGTNGWICQVDDPGGEYMVLCYHESLHTLYLRVREMAIQGKEPEERQAILGAEVKSGKFELPDYGVVFVIRGVTRDVALPLTIVQLPFATGESTGLPTKFDPHRPWLMNAGTATAHIMFPGK